MIKMKTPVVEMDGDEMTRIVWRYIKDELIRPFVELKTEYFDLGLPYRDKTDDEITIEAARANKRLGVGVKCATITPNAQRLEEYALKRLYPSPNATIRAELDGTVFRKPIQVEGIEPLVPTWKQPITIARHAYGDIYSGVELFIERPGTVKMSYESDLGRGEIKVHEFSGEGVVVATHNKRLSIDSFARSCFEYALETGEDLWFGAKDTILKIYDGEFKERFQSIFEQEYENKFEEAGINYYYLLIDDAVARVMRSNGGFIWACKNYDGDVMSDMIATVFGSLAMMTSVLVSPDGNYEYEAAHGTVTRHYYKHLKGESTSTNPLATIFAWTGGLSQRGQMDGIDELVAFAEGMERACRDTIASGLMTGDLVSLSTNKDAQKRETKQFIIDIRQQYEKSLA